MAAKKGSVVTIEVDGHNVEVDLGYTQSWDGLRKAARMSSSERTMEERGVAMVEYYEHAIANMDDVSAEMSGASADDVMEILSKAVQEATPKN